MRTFCDLEGDVNPWLTINHVRLDFDFFVSAIFVKGGKALHALAQQFVAELSSREHKPVWLNRDLLHKLIPVDMLVAAKADGLNSVAPPPVYVVDQVDIGGLLLKISGYFHVKVAFALKEIDQVSPTLFHQIRINGALGKYRNQLFHLPSAQERKPRKFRTLNSDFDDRTWLGVKKNVSVVGVSVIMRLVEVHLAGQAVLIG